MKKIKYIYIVTGGIFFHGVIYGGFSSRKLANAFRRCYKGDARFSDMCVCRVEVDVAKDELLSGYKPFHVEMNSSGEVAEVYRVNQPRTPRFGFYRLENCCLAENRNHAIELTNELRVKLLNEDRWGDSEYWQESIKFEE